MKNVELIVFTKYLKDLDLENLIKCLKFVNADGADLCVREGYIITPENIDRKLPEVVKIFNDEGLSIPMITGPGDWDSSSFSYTEKVFESCANSGIELIKIGYWVYEGNYWKKVEEIKKEIEGFLKLCEKYKRKILIHNHSGKYMGVTIGSVLTFLKGFSNKYIGVYLDPGHLSINGEPIEIAFDMVKEYISAIAVKNLLMKRKGNKWVKAVVTVEEGFVNWNNVFEELKKIDFTGPLSMHSEYDNFNIEEIISQTKNDIKYIREIMQNIFNIKK